MIIVLFAAGRGMSEVYRKTGGGYNINILYYIGTRSIHSDVDYRSGRF